MPQIIPIVIAVAGVAASMYQSSQQQASAEKAQKANILQQQQTQAANIATQQQIQPQALEQWKSLAYPSASYLSAQAQQNMGALGQAKLGSYQNLASTLAAKGFGAGSGLMAAGGAGIEKSYLQALGQQASELTKLGATPMFGPPSQAFATPIYQTPIYKTPVSGTIESGMGTASGMLEKALGYYQTQTMLENLIKKNK